MFTKKIFSLFAVLIFLVFTHALSYGYNDMSHKAIRYYAHRSEWLHSVNKYSGATETDQNKSMPVNTAYGAELSEGGGASEGLTPGTPAIATVSFYPLYEREYFYRNSESEPISDFRSYDTKSVMPEADYYGVVKHTRPIRDFRDYWPNNNEQ
jgi:hypothetical protein